MALNNEENMNIYRKCRKELELTRNEASELLEVLSVDRLERIENEKAYPNPFEVKVMAEKYKAPHLCNYYCTHECEIGREYVPEVKIKDLSQIVLETLASLNSINDKRNRLIEITVDGKITGDELKDFVSIKNELEKVSMTIDSLKLWTEQKLADGSINNEEFEKVIKELKL